MPKSEHHVTPTELLEAIKPDVQPISPFDLPLAQSGLDVEQARLHPSIYKADPERLEAAVDGIYVAANAGNMYARFLIEFAGRAQATFYPEESKAFPDTVAPSAEDLDLYESIHMVDELRAGPLDRSHAFAMLDTSISMIELAIEDAHVAERLVDA